MNVTRGVSGRPGVRVVEHDSTATVRTRATAVNRQLGSFRQHPGRQVVGFGGGEDVTLSSADDGLFDFLALGTGQLAKLN
ncbi:MAG TPA: hypothetical protein VGL75_05375, partial [Acidothermaceae bacterium]